MKTLRRYAYATFFVACTHLVFGAIVRISGSGMGCGDHWPKCYGSFFPPLDRPDLIIEVSHRYLASILLLSLIVLLVAAWRRRAEAGVGGRGGVLRGAALAVALGVSAALLGAVTVKMGNAPFATLAHWTVAMSLVATVVATLIRTGGLGGESIRVASVTPRTRRGALAAAGVALVTVVMGGLTAKYPGAAVACQAFPLCGTNPDVAASAVYVQVVHRVLAALLVLHLIGLAMAIRGRREPSLIVRVAFIAMGFGILQILVAGAMIGMHLPPVLRSLHEATGVSVWISSFVLAYLARIGGDGRGVREPRPVPSPDDLADAGEVRVPAMASKAYSSAIAEPPRRSKAEPPEPWQGEAESAAGVVAAPSLRAVAPREIRLAPAEIREAPVEIRVAPAEIREAPVEIREVSAEIRVASAEIRAASAESPAASAESRAASAESRAASAESPAASAEIRAASADVRSARAELLIAPADVHIAAAELLTAPAAVLLTSTDLFVASTDLFVAPMDLPTRAEVVIAPAEPLVTPANVLVARAEPLLTPANVLVAPAGGTVVTTADPVAQAVSEDLRVAAAALQGGDDVSHEPAPASTRLKTTRGSTMRHSIAVIVARGADL